MPEHKITHMDGCRANNAWNNLKHVTQTCSLQNNGLQKNNTSGFKGVFWNKRGKNWMARIKINNKEIYLGLHEDTVSAALARCLAEDCLADWHCDERAVNRVKLRDLGFKV